MDEPRRIDVKHVGPAISKKKERKNEPSYRFEIELRESTTDYFPEISFADLVEDRKKSEVPLDLGENVNMKEVEAIAKRMEEKYGGGSKRKRQVEDFCDLGEGYDDNDSFIDNAEAYDELVPSYLTTKLGGFYINSGSLDFKEVSHSASADGNGDDSSSEFQSRRKRKRRIKVLGSMSEDDELHVKKKKTRRVRAMTEDTEGDEKPRKKRLSNHTPVVLGRPKKQKNKSMFDSDTEKGKKGEAISENVARKYDSVIDDVINQYMQGGSSSEEPGLNGVGGITASSEPNASKAQAAGTGATISMPPNSSAGSSPVLSDGNMPKELPKLPCNLPDSCLSQIDELKKIAECSSDGKQKFFSADVNQMLLRLAMDIRHLSGSHRRGVYTYLACFLPVGRETLMKRIKLLTLKEEASKLRAPLDKLKQAVEQAMPSLMDKYHIDSAAAALARLESREADAAAADKMKEEPAALSDEDDRVTDLPQLTENGSDKKVRNFTVRKKFPWTDQLRLLLCTVVQLKMDSYLTTKTKGQLADDFLKDFLDQEVKVFWPKGWMQTRVLYKESRVAHGRWTSQPLSKLKKAGLLGVAKAADVAAMPQLRRAEPEKVPAGSGSLVVSGVSAPSTPRAILDDIDDDAEDSESLGDECASSSDELPLVRKEDDCPGGRSASTPTCRAEAHTAAGSNANNSNSGANGFRLLAKQPASCATVAAGSGSGGSMDRTLKIRLDTPSRDVAACTASTPASAAGGVVIAVSTGAVASAAQTGRPLALGATGSVPARAAIFPALTAAVSKAATVDRQNVGAAAVPSIVKAARSSCDSRSQGHVTVAAARPHSVPNAVSILDTSRVVATNAAASAAAKVALLGDRGANLGALPSSSVHSAIGKVMVKFSHGSYQRPSSELQRHQHDHPSTGRGAATITVKRQPQQAEQQLIGAAAVATTTSNQRDPGSLPASRGRLPSANHVVTTSLAPGSTTQHSAGGSSVTATLAGHVHFQNKPGNLPVPSSGSQTFGKPESRPGPQGVTGSHETVQQPFSQNSQTSIAGGVTTSPLPSKTQTAWHQATPRPPYIVHQPARPLTPQQQLLQQQQRQSQPLQQQQSRVVQHRPALTPEQFALKEMQRQQQGHLTVDQIMKLVPASAQYGSSGSSSANNSASLQQLPIPAKLNSTVPVQAAMSAVGQASSKLHQPWAINAKSAQAGPVSESFCVPSQPSARAGRVDTGIVVHGTLPSSLAALHQLSADRLAVAHCRSLPQLADLSAQGCTTSVSSISRSPMLTQRSAMMASQLVGSSSIISDHTGVSFSSTDQAYPGSLPKKP